MLENFKSNKNKFKLVRFSKQEINKIMEIYSIKIAIGEWKDYSIFFSKNCAIFNIHKSFSRSPEFKILKYYQNREKYTLSNKHQILAKSTSLNKLLTLLKKPNLRLIK